MNAKPLPRKAPGPLALVLLGVSGSGKSTVGRLLAPKLGAVFLEGDDYHASANVAKMRAGVPLADADRWPWLQAIGQSIAEHIGSGRPVVVACSALRVTYRSALETAAHHPLVFIHLTIDPRILAARMQARRQHFMPTSLLESQLATLEPLRDDEDGIEIVETGTALRAVAAIEHWLDLRAHGNLSDRREEGRHRRPSAQDHPGDSETDPKGGPAD